MVSVEIQTGFYQWIDLGGYLRNALRRVCYQRWMMVGQREGVRELEEEEVSRLPQGVEEGAEHQMEGVGHCLIDQALEQEVGPPLSPALSSPPLVSYLLPCLEPQVSQLVADLLLEEEGEACCHQLSPQLSSCQNLPQPCPKKQCLTYS